MCFIRALDLRYIENIFHFFLVHRRKVSLFSFLYEVNVFFLMVFVFRPILPELYKVINIFRSTETTNLWSRYDNSSRTMGAIPCFLLIPTERPIEINLRPLSLLPLCRTHFSLHVKLYLNNYNFFSVHYTLCSISKAIITYCRRTHK